MQLTDPIKLFEENRHLISIEGFYYKFIAVLKPRNLMTEKENEILNFILCNDYVIIKHFTTNIV